MENLNISLSENIFKYTNRVTFELSNMCQYTNVHTSCPLSLETSKKLLPSDVVYNVIDCLSKYNYMGSIAFHRYNEPLMDPRLFEFIRYSKKMCKNSFVYILTNGYYLAQQLLNELIEVVVSQIDVTGYSSKEIFRLLKLKSSIPLNDLIITRDANVGLCHFDWKLVNSFGNLIEHSIEDIILNSNIMEVYDDLTKGTRKLELCKKCTCSTQTSELSFYYSNIYFNP